ncbi:MAG: hypothetical protein J0L92_03400 [Deltaproteobacteria bacterium]|nr:hypothetical protein [Deltaproteobacteria bacterium]
MARGIDNGGVNQINLALTVLSRTHPETYTHFMREVRQVLVSRICGPGAVACTWAPGDPRAVHLAAHPLDFSLTELVLTLGHEGLHHWTVNGVHYQVPHSCQNCGNPRERGWDVIYQWEDEARYSIERAVMHVQLYGVVP